MGLLAFILVIAFILWLLYMTFEPRIDVVTQPRKKVVLLWYNLFVDGRRDLKRAYKRLFTIKQL